MKFDMQGMMEKVKKMQEEMEKVKAEAMAKIVSAESGGGMVKVTMNGAGEIIDLIIEKELLNPDEKNMLEDLVVAAVNKASNEAKSMVNDEMSSIKNMLPNIPGLNLNL
jgi:DNA-binding YbaB/EbfC family protein